MDLRMAGLPDDAPGVISIAVGPLVRGERKPPILRIRFSNRVFYIENKHGTGKLGQWRPIGEAAQFAPALEKMHELNMQTMAKHGLSVWPSPAETQAELSKYGIAVE